ncbi:hypothetical protein V6N13_041659 [Hibiscus sabdariffa]
MVDVYFDCDSADCRVSIPVYPRRKRGHADFASSLLGLWDPGFFLYFSLEIEFLTFGLIFIELHLQG